VNKNIVLAGSISGFIGMAVCAVAGLARVAGLFYVLGFQSTTLFNVGVGLMVFGCLIKLEELAAQGRSKV
jgi:hypothetical protein